MEPVEMSHPDAGRMTCSPAAAAIHARNGWSLVGAAPGSFDAAVAPDDNNSAPKPGDEKPTTAAPAKSRKENN